MGLATIFGVAILALFFMTATGPGRNLTASLISGAASNERQSLEIVGLSNIWSGPLTVDSVTVGDREGAWLKMSDISVDLDRGALLGLAFVTESLRIGQLHVLRRPLSPSEPKPESSGELPVNEVSIRSVDLPEIILDQSVAGAAARLALNGDFSLVTDPMDLAVTLAARRTDGIAGELDVTLSFAPDEERLVLDVGAREPQGGVVSGLIGLPGAPPLEVSLKGNGSLADFVARLGVSVNKVQTVAGEFRVLDEGATRQLSGTLNGRIAPFLPQAIRPLVAGDLAFLLDASLADGTAITLKSLSVKSATASLRASGGADLDERTISGQFSAKLGEAGTRLVIEAVEPAPLSVGAVVLAGEVTGRLDSADWKVNARIAEIGQGSRALEGLVADLSGDGADLTARNIPFVLELAAANLETANPAADALLAGPLRVRANGALKSAALAIERASLASAATQLDLSGETSLSARDFAFQIAAAINPNLEHSLSRWLAGAPLALETRIGRIDGDRMTISNAKVDGALIEATANATLEGDILDMSLKADVPDLANADPRLEGGLTFAASAKGPVSAPELVVDARGQDVILLGEALEGLAFSLKAIANRNAPTGTLEASAQYRGQSLTIVTRAELTETGITRIAPARIAIAGSRIEGAATLGPAGPDGQFRITVADLGDLGPLLLRDDLAGALSGLVRLSSKSSGEESRTDLSLALTAPALAGFGSSARDLAINADIADLLGAPQPSGNLSVGLINAGDIHVERLNADAQIVSEGTRFAIDASLDGSPLSTAGTLRTGERITLAMDNFEGAYKSVAMRLAAPTVIGFVDDGVQLDNARIGLGGGLIAIDGRAGSTLALNATLSGISASVANAIAPQLGLSGAISGRVGVSGAAADPQISYDVNWSGASARALVGAGVGVLAIAADGTYKSRSVRLNSRITGAGGLTFSVNGGVDLGAVPRPDLAVSGTVPFELAAAQLAKSGLRLSGAAQADLTIRGALSAPEISGQITTTGARFIDTKSNIVLNGLAGRIRLTGKTATLESFTGEIASGGNFSASGTVGLDNGFPGDLKLNINDGRYTDGSIVSAGFGADMTVTGPLATAPVIGGTINIARADVTLPDSLPGGVDIVSVQHRNASAKVDEQAASLQPKGGSGSAALRLNLQINAPRQIFVRGRGVDGEFGGRIQLGGPATSPSAIGKFTLIRGRLDVLGRRLAFSRGSIGFSGSLLPDIDFSADTIAAGTTVTLGLVGPANDPKVKISSTPTLPEDEALALLIFGRSVNNLSPVQIAQLVDALANLAGGGSPGVLGKLRNAVGVDSLDITPDESGQGAAVSVGRYINERTFVGVSQGTDAGSTRVTIDLDITDNIKARGETSANGTTKGGLFFERNY